MKTEPIILLTIFFICQIPVLGVWLIIQGPSQIANSYWIYGIVTAGFGLVANLLFIYSLKHSDLSLTIPILGLVPMFTTFLGALTLQEIPSLLQNTGITFSVIGLIIIYLPENSSNPYKAIKTLIKNKGARYMLCVAVLWSTTAPLDKICVQQSSASLHGFIQVCIAASVLLIYSLVFKNYSNKHFNKQYLIYGIFAAIAASVAYAAQLLAYQLIFVGIVESLKRTVGLLSALILGTVLLKEPLTKKKVKGIILIIIGLPLIMLQL